MLVAVISFVSRDNDCSGKQCYYPHFKSKGMWARGKGSFCQGLGPEFDSQDSRARRRIKRCRLFSDRTVPTGYTLTHKHAGTQNINNVFKFKLENEANWFELKKLGAIAKDCYEDPVSTNGPGRMWPQRGVWLRSR